MTIGYAIFGSVITAFVLMIIISFWIDKLGGDLSLAGYALVFLACAIVTFCFILLAPLNVQNIALYIGIGVLILTLIVHLISQL